MRFRFWKTQSVGNDFVLVHRDEAPDDYPALAQSVCARRFGVGSDGLLVVWMQEGTLHLRMFNPDGSEDFCGNGARCAALHAWKQGWVGEAKLPMVQFGRPLRARRGEGDEVVTVGEPASFRPGDVPHEAGQELFQAPIGPVIGSSLSTGSTHLVVPVGELPDDATVERVGRELEHHPLFPERTSVIWSRASGEHELRLAIWERGAGQTLGCGTGSVAAAVVAARMRGYGGRFDVCNPGGLVRVRLQTWSDAPEAGSVPQESYCGWAQWPPSA